MREQTRYLRTVTVFGTRAPFFGDSNEVRFGGERVERVIVRGTEPEYIEAIPLFSIAQVKPPSVVLKTPLSSFGPKAEPMTPA